MSEKKDKKVLIQLTESESELKEQKKLLLLAQHLAEKNSEKLSPNVIDSSIIKTAIDQIDEQLILKKKNPSNRKDELSKES
jgi:hypothetical protein